MDTQETTARRMTSNARHNPWDRLSAEDRTQQLDSMGARPIKWTLDLSKINTVSEDGYVYVFAGGPLEGVAPKEPRKRSDGKVDGRSKGVRKCGRCGGSGHNARTCKGTPLPKAPVTPKAVATKAVTSEPVKAPEPQKTVARKPEPRQAVRQATKVPGKKTCGTCGGVGHNARTCSKKGTAKVVVSREAPKGTKAAEKRPRGSQSPLKGRQKTCGTCGGKGHNARTCKG